MKRALTLLEVVLVVAIIGMLAAFAIPRFSRATVGADDPAPRYNLNLLRFAIELYYHEHGAYPAQNGDGTHGAGTQEAFANQLTRFTDAYGRTSETRDDTYRFGPYLRLGIPPCPVTPRKGQTAIAMVTVRPAYTASATEAGWVYNCDTGDIALNSNALDPDGASYDGY